MSNLRFVSPSGRAVAVAGEGSHLHRVAWGPASIAWRIDIHGDLEHAERLLAVVPETPQTRWFHEKLAEARAARARFYAEWAAVEAAGGIPASTVHPDHAAQRELLRALRGTLRVEDLPLVIAGHTLSSRDVDLNTALVAGSDPVRFAAKASGWAYTWVEGPDREWLAGVIDDGVRTGIFRRGLWVVDEAVVGPVEDHPDRQWRDVGWDGVLEFLRSRSDEPVVVHQSAEGPFPCPDLADGFDPLEDPDEVAWSALSDAEQWAAALGGLRRDRPWAQLSPEFLGRYHFGAPVSVFDVVAPDREDRVRAAFASEEYR